ncbi:peptidoglycan-binding domain-containing protein [Breoghania sp. L-A4]|uniref:peptidoglycan-binding domain-containing protein n=1 Tax=Breoghania sp. L-A4 TaxID=2304600 RepID=UPI000E360A6F|nr:peptidoglycan-binding domain-containing protein [Breoghania sp. L-A4]AXS40699.1 peptidoglycan-binding protein [Breoghania sp. L-A4]
MLISKKATIAAAILALTTGSAHAGAGEFIAGVAVGAIGKTIIDHATRNNNNGGRRQNVRRTTPQESAASRAERARVRQETVEVQTRLGMLGFDPGPVDGAMGRQTRTAIREFQASIGHRVTGRLSEEQLAILYSRTNEPVSPTEANYQMPPSPPPYQPAPQRVELPENAPRDTYNLPMQDPTSGRTADAGTLTDQFSSATIDGGAIGGATFEGTPPEVLGIRLGGDAPGARAKMEAAGFSACTETGRQLTCQTSNAVLKDTVTLAYTRNEAETKIHTITRTIKFNQPVAREHVIDKLAQSYPDLIDAPGHRRFASRDCASLAGPSGGVVIEGIMSWSKQNTPVTPSIGSLASSCGYFYSFDVADSADVDTVNIALFEGAPITEAMQQESGAANPLDQQVRF